MKFFNLFAIILALIIGITAPLAAMHKRPYDVMLEKPEKSALYCEEALGDSDSEKENAIPAIPQSLASLTAQVEKETMKANDEIDPLRKPAHITPIIKAICQNDARAVVRILQQWDKEGTLETNINQRNTWGETALHIAASTSHEHFLAHAGGTVRRNYLQEKRRIIHALMHAGANHKIRSKLNRTARSQATEYLNKANAKIIRSYIAEALKEENNITDADENTSCLAWGV